MHTFLEFLKARSGRLLGLTAIVAAMLADHDRNRRWQVLPPRWWRPRIQLWRRRLWRRIRLRRLWRRLYVAVAVTPAMEMPAAIAAAGHTPRKASILTTQPIMPDMSAHRGVANTCGGAPYAYAPAAVPQMAMNMPPATSVTPASGTTTGQNGIIQASGTAPTANEMGLKVVDVEMARPKRQAFNKGSSSVTSTATAFAPLTKACKPPFAPIGRER